MNRRKYAIAALGGKCAKCGATDRLEFDHIEPSTKLFKISDVARREDLWLAELAKCQLLCNACHREKTAQEIRCGVHSVKPAPTHGTHSCYVTGCRCEPCTVANREYHRARAREYYRKHYSVAARAAKSA